MQPTAGLKKVLMRLKTGDGPFVYRTRAATGLVSFSAVGEGPEALAFCHRVRLVWALGAFPNTPACRWVSGRGLLPLPPASLAAEPASSI
jgi:hypothetical protein